MEPFSYSEFPDPVRTEIVTAQRHAWTRLAEPGTWWTAAERVAIAAEVRAARAQRSEPPWLRDAKAVHPGVLSDLARETARTIAVDAHKLDRKWCDAVIAELGDAPYVELAGVVVCVTAIDAFCEALGAALEPLPEPKPGEPSQTRPDGVGDAGAWVPMTDPFPGPNVGRALSLVPDAQMTFFALVGAMYSGQDFAKLDWGHRALARPQVELVAARVSALNECFY